MSEQKKIIVVDDIIENLTVIKNILKDQYEVYPCQSASKMFELLEHIKPDLFLLDVKMPEINGYETAKKLKSRDDYKQIPVIFITSLDDAESEMEGLSIGAVDYIHRPYAAHLLSQRIKTHLSMVDRQKEIENLLELKIKEISLREAAETEARNASRAKSEFISRMSQEIRSPLNAVLGMITIAADTNNIQAVKRYLEKADTASRYVLGVINDIIDMSKIEADKFELSYNEFNLKKALTDIVSVIRVRAEEKRQNLTLNVNENVPPLIISDELRLTQVISNLLANAVKFTPENGKVTLNVEKQDESGGEITLRFAVADSGIGISTEQQEQLFKSYIQADDSIEKNFDGTRLGLFISRRIVELMQGEIKVESELNKGAKFIFTIKAKKGSSNAEIGSPGRSNKTNNIFKKITILAVDDMEINKEILARYLDNTGISVDFAENGKLAVSMFQEYPDKYSLIFMDIHMPEMDGYEATRTIRGLEKELRKNTARIPIIAMTADVFKEDIEKCISAGMDDHISKPIVPKDIFVKFREYLGY
jgi:signal transduction histidine kinase